MSVCKSSRVGKIEKPRPLRSTSITTTTSVKGVDDVLLDLERVCQMLKDERFSPALSTAITSLWYHIKLMGHQMEYACKDDLDRQFGHLRNACRDERLDRASRVRLLELIELRAQRTPWTPNDNISAYYTQMLLMIEGQQMCDGDVVYGGGAPQLPALLTAGEVVRGSGKYPRPTKIQGRFKDEVVIRNSDSGKALHGAKERMVQISGETEDNVLLARGLMDDVIRRNASPVLDHCGGGGSLLGSTGDGSLSCSAHSPNTSDSDHQQLNDAGNGVWPNRSGSLGEFRYTVFVNGHAIKLSCKDADAIKAAKVVLDEYFTNGFQTQPQRNSAKLVSNTPTGQLNVSRGMSGGGECVSPTDLLLTDAFLATSSPFTAEVPPKVAVTSADNMVYNNSYDSTPPSSLDLEDAVACAPVGSPCPSDVVDAVEYRRYDRAQLLEYSSSAVARCPPRGWTAVQSRLPDIARAIARKFDVVDFVTRSSSVPPLLQQQRRRSSGSNSDPAGYGTVGSAENPSGL